MRVCRPAPESAPAPPAEVEEATRRVDVRPLGSPDRVIGAVTADLEAERELASARSRQAAGRRSRAPVSETRRARRHPRPPACSHAACPHYGRRSRWNRSLRDLLRPDEPWTRATIDAADGTGGSDLSTRPQSPGCGRLARRRRVVHRSAVLVRATRSSGHAHSWRHRRLSWLTEGGPVVVEFKTGRAAGPEHEAQAALYRPCAARLRSARDPFPCVSCMPEAEGLGYTQWRSLSVRVPAESGFGADVSHVWKFRDVPREDAADAATSGGSTTSCSRLRKKAGRRWSRSSATSATAASISKASTPPPGAISWRRSAPAELPTRPCPCTSTC